MPQVQHIVSEVFQGTVRSGRSAGKPFWSVTTNTGNRLTCFEEKYVQDLEIGKEYTFEIEAKGEYVNIVGAPTPVVQLDDRDTHIEAHSKVEEKLGFTTQESERTYKNRISALQAAVQYVIGTMAGTHSDEDFKKIVKDFEEYINTGG